MDEINKKRKIVIDIIRKGFYSEEIISDILTQLEKNIRYRLASRATEQIFGDSKEMSIQEICDIIRDEIKVIVENLNKSSNESITQSPKGKSCPKCKGKRVIELLINGIPAIVQCPKCHGKTS
jgi:predicted methyltransferase